MGRGSGSLTRKDWGALSEGIMPVDWASESKADTAVAGSTEKGAREAPGIEACARLDVAWSSWLKIDEVSPEGEATDESMEVEIPIDESEGTTLALCDTTEDADSEVEVVARLAASLAEMAEDAFALALEDAEPSGRLSAEDGESAVLFPESAIRPVACSVGQAHLDSDVSDTTSKLCISMALPCSSVCTILSVCS